PSRTSPVGHFESHRRCTQIKGKPLALPTQCHAGAYGSLPETASTCRQCLPAGCCIGCFKRTAPKLAPIYAIAVRLQRPGVHANVVGPHKSPSSEYRIIKLQHGCVSVKPGQSRRSVTAPPPIVMQRQCRILLFVKLLCFTPNPALKPAIVIIYARGTRKGYIVARGIGW